MSTTALKLAVLISGGGTTLDNLVKVINEGTLDAEISLVISSRPDARGVEKAKAYGLPIQVIARGDYSTAEQFSRAIFEKISQSEAQLVVMAGYLALLNIPEEYHLRVMNIHPSLIPSFSGPRMYGQHVHNAVLERGVKISGCTVHFADAQYDEGPIIIQKPVPVFSSDSAQELAARVFEAECEAYPEAIRLYQQKRLKVVGSIVEILDEAETIEE